MVNDFYSKLSLYLYDHHSYKYAIFYSHKPFYWKSYSREEPGCFSNHLYFKPFEDILNYFNFNLFLSGHVHHYLRQSNLYNYGTN